MRPLLFVFGAAQLVLGLLLWLTPGFFYDEIGPYPPRNDHYMADLATFYLALGAVALASVSRERWRVPVLTLALVQYGLHSLNHLIDIGDSHPGWLGRRTSCRSSSPPSCSAGWSRASGVRSAWPPSEQEASMIEDESPRERDVHHALNEPASDPDPTEWPDPYDKRPDPRRPRSGFGGARLR